MNTLDELATEVHSHLSGFGLVSPRAGWLASSVSASDTEFQLDGTVTTGSGEGVAEIDSELVYVRSVDRSTNRIKIAPDGRGWDGTTAASHPALARITFEPPFPKSAIRRAINVAIERTYPSLRGVDVHEFVYNPSKLSYGMPADADGILSVAHETYGGTDVWEDIHSYSFDGNADVGTFPSGNSITLMRTVPAGRTVRVLYSKRPAPLASGSSQLSESGLADSAKYAVILGASAHLLRFNDPARLAPLSASADEYDNKRPYLTGVKLANDFEMQFQTEVLAEAKRFRQTYPARIVRKKF